MKPVIRPKFLPAQAALRASSRRPSRSSHSSTAASTGVGLFQWVQVHWGQRSRDLSPPSSAATIHSSALAQFGQNRNACDIEGSGREDPGRQIAVAAVADDEHDGRVLDSPGDLQRGPQCPSRRNAGEQTFFACQPPCHVLGVRLADVDGLVDTAGLVDLRQVGLGPLADAGDPRAFAGLRANDAHAGVLRLQIGGYAGDRAGGAHRADEVRDLPLGVVPDLRAGGLDVDARVVGIGELVEHPALAFALQPLGQVARVLHAAGLGCQHQFGSEGAHRLRPLDRQILRHDQQHAVAADGRCHRQRDAGVARGCLDQGVARLDLAAFLGAADHADGRTVLHRPRRVVALELAEDHVAAPLVLGARQAHQANQRGSADRVFNGQITRHRGTFLRQLWQQPKVPVAESPRFIRASVAKSVDARDSKSRSAMSVGSSPTRGTTPPCTLR
eukprot:Opistho-1_new@63648